MTIRRLASLQLILLGGLSSVFLLPKDIKVQPAGIDISLPDLVNDWKGADQSVTKAEQDSLGPDTQFARKLYTRGADELYVSIVLSGPDMNTSIHRPERCLPAQGWTIVDSKMITVPIPAGAIKATRLQNVRSVPTNDGKLFTLRSVDYYWFVGSSDVTGSHFQRTWIDIRDRILKGRNQQWAYVTIASNITRDFKARGRSEIETDELIQSFIRDLVPQIQKSRPLLRVAEAGREQISSVAD